MRRGFPVVLLFWVCWGGGCGGVPAPDSGLSERGFAELYVATLRLEREYAGFPDRLRAHREALFERLGVGEADVAAFIEARGRDPAQWQGVLRYVEMAVEADSTLLRRGVRDSIR